VSDAAITQADIDVLLQRLTELVARLAAARADAAPLEGALAAAQREYDAAVGGLRRRELALTAELQSLSRSTAALDDAAPLVDADIEHQPVIPPDDPTQVAALDADALDKDVLLEHVVRVLDTMDDRDAQELVVMLQQAVDDPTATLGDALEQLPPGPVWERLAPHETLGDQHRRLLRWTAALEQRLADVKAKTGLVATDPRHGLWRQRERGIAEWRRFLERAEAHQRARNAELEVRLAELRDKEVEA
jgi:hypothetical protein